MLRLVKQLSPVALERRIRARRRRIYAWLHGHGTQSSRGMGMIGDDSPLVAGHLIPAGIQQCRPAYPIDSRRPGCLARVLAQESMGTRLPAVIHIGINLYPWARHRRLVLIVCQGQVLTLISIAPFNSGLASVMLSLSRILEDQCAQRRERCRF